LKLETAARAVGWIGKDERMGPLLQKLQNASIGTDLSNTQVSSKAGSVRLEDIPALAKRSFPMCGRYLEVSLTREHHLKHESRLQLTLFLKGIGLSMDDCIAYMQREFGKRPTTSEEFRKKGYLYAIEHSYGQRGKRANYPPWSCATTLSKKQTAPDQRHGCPFKELSAERLSQMVKETGVPEPALKKIGELVKNHEYQIACRLHWEILHPKGNSEPVGNHPNAWFDESMKYYAEKEKAEKEEQAATPAISQDINVSVNDTQMTAVE
jgi:DNA primase large subunit